MITSGRNRVMRARMIPRCAIIRRVLGGMLRILVVGLGRARRGHVPVAARPARLSRLRRRRCCPSRGHSPTCASTDQAAGKTRELERSAGDFTLLFFGFTNCPDVCPLTLSLLADTRARHRRERAERGSRREWCSSASIRAATRRRSIAAYLQNFDPEFLGAHGRRRGARAAAQGARRRRREARARRRELQRRAQLHRLRDGSGRGLASQCRAARTILRSLASDYPEASGSATEAPPDPSA